MELRDYQNEIKDELYAAWEQGARSVMCQLPTGTGKTVLAVSVIGDWLRDHADEEGCVLVVAHRREILEQVRDTLRGYGLGDMLTCGRVVVESVQRLTRALSSPVPYGVELSPSLVIVDEAHHAAARTYRLLWDRWTNARFVGLTATPCRLMKEGFTDLFDRLVCSWQVSRFIREGWLSLFEYVAVSPDSDMLRRVKSLRKRGADGDYQMKEMGAVMDNRASIEQLYRSYKEYADGRQGIIYAINRVHAAHIKEFYERNGESVMLIDSMTPKGERDRLMEAYRRGEVKILCNCEIAGEGVDVPECSFIQLARPTLSLSKFLQQVGRGLRPHVDKQKTMILDNVGLYYMFGLPNEDRDWRRMFSEGQVLRSVKCASVVDGMVDMRHTVMDVDDGHERDMVVVMSDGMLARKAEAVNKEYEVFRGDNGGYGIIKGERVCCLPAFECIDDLRDGYALVTEDGKRRVIDMEGNVLYENEGIVRLLPKGMVEVHDMASGVYYCDVKCGIEYVGKMNPPSVVLVDFVEFVCFGDSDVFLRMKRGESFRFTKKDMMVKGDVLQRKDERTGVTLFVHRKQPDSLYRLVGFDSEYRKVLICMSAKQGVCFYKNGVFSYSNDPAACVRWGDVDRRVNAKWHEIASNKTKTKTKTINRQIEYQNEKTLKPK